MPIAVAGPPLRRNRGFVLLWVSQSLSLLGTSISSLAYPLLVLAHTGSAAQAGMVTAALSGSVLAFKVPAGRLVDAHPGTTLMIGADAIRAAAVGAVAVAVASGSFSLGLVVAVSVVEAVGGVVFAPAEFSVLRGVVAAGQRRDAIARAQARSQFAGLAGPLVGGALYAVDPALPFAADAASYVLSLLLITGVRPLTAATSTRSPTRGAALGWRWLRTQRGLWVTGWWSAGLTATFAAVGFILLTLARSRGATPSAMGVMYALSAAGGVLGALATPRLMQRWTGRTLLRAAVWVDTAAALALLPTSSAYVMGGIGLAAFFLVPTVPAVLLGRLAVTCPDAIAGRAQAALTLIMGGFAPIAAPLAGVAVDRFGARVAVACCAGAFGLLGAAALLVLPSDDDTDARR